MFDLTVNKDQYCVFASSVDTEVVKEFLDNNNIGFKELQGCYKGVEEDSFIINIDFMHYVKLAGILDGEESVLILDQEDGGKRPAYLLYMKDYYAFERDNDDSVLQSIGRMQEVPEEVAKAADAYSYRPDLGKYFLAA